MEPIVFPDQSVENNGFEIFSNRSLADDDVEYFV